MREWGWYEVDGYVVWEGDCGGSIEGWNNRERLWTFPYIHSERDLYKKCLRFSYTMKPQTNKGQKEFMTKPRTVEQRKERKSRWSYLTHQDRTSLGPNTPSMNFCFLTHFSLGQIPLCCCCRAGFALKVCQTGCSRAGRENSISFRVWMKVTYFTNPTLTQSWGGIYLCSTYELFLSQHEWENKSYSTCF